MRMGSGGALGMGGKLFFSYFIEFTYFDKKKSSGMVTIIVKHTYRTF